MPFLLLPSAGTRMDRPVINSFLPLRGCGTGRAVCSLSLEIASMQGSRSHSLLLAKAVPSSLVCLLSPRLLKIDMLAFGGCLAVPETPGLEFPGLALACAVRGSALLGRSIPWCDHRARGCCVKSPETLLQMVPSSAALAEVAEPPPRSWQSSQSHRSIWLLQRGEAQVLPHTALHESIWRAWEGQGHGDTLKYSTGINKKGTALLFCKKGEYNLSLELFLVGHSSWNSSSCI